MSVRRYRTAAAVLAAPLLAALTLAPVGISSAAPDAYAPVDQPGPALTPAATDLAASLRCSPNLATATKTPVLLLAGTTANSTQNWSWTYQPLFNAKGIPWCASDVPTSTYANQNMADIQTRGEYVTYAIRTMYERAGRKISILGWSQGGMVPRWSLRFWPDVRPMVDDVIGLTPSNHGTEPAKLVCAVPCSEAFWQQRSDSRFIEAINSHQQTFAGISYTVVTTDFDEVVVPSSYGNLTGPGQVSNNRMQAKCPGHLADHTIGGTMDAVSEAFVMDALTHAGPASAGRISPLVCLRPYMSSVNVVTAALNYPQVLAAAASSVLLPPLVTAEPELECYVFAEGC